MGSLLHIFLRARCSQLYNWNTKMHQHTMSILKCRQRITHPNLWPNLHSGTPLQAHILIIELQVPILLSIPSTTLIPHPPYSSCIRSGFKNMGHIESDYCNIHEDINWCMSLKVSSTLQNIIRIQLRISMIHKAESMICRYLKRDHCRFP